MEGYRTSYLRQVVCAELRDTAVKRAIRDIEKDGRQFDAIAVRGMSGATMGAILAHALDKDLIIVRKDADGTHSPYEVEGPDNGPINYIIVDDLVSSGRTIEAVLSKVYKEMPDAECVGLYLFYLAPGGDPESIGFDDSCLDRRKHRVACDRLAKLDAQIPKAEAQVVKKDEPSPGNNASMPFNPPRKARNWNELMASFYLNKPTVPARQMVEQSKRASVYTYFDEMAKVEAGFIDDLLARIQRDEERAILTGQPLGNKVAVDIETRGSDV